MKNKKSYKGSLPFILFFFLLSQFIYAQTPIGIAIGESQQIERTHTLTLIPITHVTLNIGGPDSMYVTATVNSHFVDNLKAHLDYTLKVLITAPIGSLSIRVTAEYHTDNAVVQPISEDFIIDTTVLPSIVASFSADVLVGEAPLTVNFTDESTGDDIQIYSWDFGDGSNSQDKDPVHVYQESGLYTVSLTVLNESTYHQTIKENYIQVNAATFIENSRQAPESFQLHQNYPNPFNPGTFITYQIARNSNVVVKIYDILGHELQTILDRKQNAGVYSIHFDAGNLPGGIYFYKLTAGKYTETRKMVVLK